MDSTTKVIYALGFIPITVVGISLLIGAPFLIYVIYSKYFIPQVVNYDICNLVPSEAGNAGAALSVAPSFWMAQVLFFVGYLLQNATSLYNQPSDPMASEAKVRNRREQAITAIVITTIITIAFVAIRYTTGCETAFGIAIAILTMIPLGVGWYHFASLCGARNSDVFGISAKILPIGASEPPPQVCINTTV
jgi:hypothetical protein